MHEFFISLKQRLRDGYVFLYQKSRPVRLWVLARYEQIKEYYRTHPKAKRWSIIGSIVLGPPLLLFLIVWIEIPSKSELRNIQNQVASEIYSADSVLLGRYYIQNRTEVKYEDISPSIMNALIATEDVRFYEHGGVDYVSLGRVLIKSIFMQDESSGGGSTITQQLAKNLYPRKHYWVLAMPLNKMREVITAVRLEDIYKKEDLITLYLNTIPFADQTFGIEAAAKRFFNTTAKDLTSEQAAVLIGMLKATHSYNPRLFPERALTRRNVVLSQMEKYKFITPEQSDSLQALPLGLEITRESYHQGLAPYFREYLKSELTAWCKNNFKEDGTPYNIYTDGLKIYSTIDSKLQAYAEKAVAQQMADVQKLFFDHWGRDKPWKGNDAIITDAVKRSPRYLRLREQGLEEKAIMDSLNKKIPMRLFSWTGDKDVQMSPLDSVKYYIQYLNAGFLAIEPQTGGIKAWVGGIEHDFFQYDHVRTSTKRQVGSIFKPIVYALALEKGISPCEFTSAGQQTYIDEEGEKWTPRNTQVDYRLSYTMKGALAYSVNTVAVKMIQRAGVDSTIALARNMGIQSEFKNVPSVALGSGSISLTEMTAAYACIANEGVSTFPNGISSITDLEGKTYTDFKPQQSGKRVMSKESAQLLSSMLQTVVHEGTASRLRWRYGVYNDVAGKTGTTQANADGWFMAITPKLVIGTWVGADDPRIHFRTTELGQGSSTALPMVGYFMQQVNKDPAFKDISDAKFKPLPADLRDRLDCDLYEFDESLWSDVGETVIARDSMLLARDFLLQQTDSLHQDTVKKVRDDTFIEKLYKRTARMRQATHRSDTSNIGELEKLDIED